MKRLYISHYQAAENLRSLPFIKNYQQIVVLSYEL